MKDLRPSCRMLPLAILKHPHHLSEDAHIVFGLVVVVHSYQVCQNVLWIVGEHVTKIILCSLEKSCGPHYRQCNPFTCDKL